MNTGSAFRALVVWIGAALSLSAGPVLTLNPSGLIGTPGSTVGWGFTISNDADYVEITSAQYCVNPVNFPVVCNSSALGMFNDFISQFNDIIVGPPGGTDPSIVSQNFDSVALTGIGSFAINNTAPIGAGDLGQIVLTYNLTTLDPNDPNAVSLGIDLAFAADASITISEGDMPEPGTTGLMLFALAALAVARSIFSAARGVGGSPRSR